jgi:hypothetical protein
MELVTNDGLAMYAAKQAGRDQVQVAEVDKRPAAPARSA